MGEITVGSRRFVLELREDSGQWTATARSAETGEPFGPPQTAHSAADAERRLTRWLLWQHDHAHAIAVLQEAERAYHRLVAERAFAVLPDDAVTESARRSSLQDVETARRLLDAIRATRPG